MANYLYNGVELSALPEWDRETHPYAVIRYIHNETNDYQLICLREVVYVGTGVAYKFEGSAGVYTSTIATGTNGPWSDLNALNVDFTVSPAIWANFDVLNEDGTVYLAASDPIPVNPAPTLDPTSLLMCWQVGNRIRQRV